MRSMGILFFAVLLLASHAHFSSKVGVRGNIRLAARAILAVRHSGVVEGAAADRVVMARLVVAGACRTLVSAEFRAAFRRSQCRAVAAPPRGPRPATASHVQAEADGDVADGAGEEEGGMEGGMEGGTNARSRLLRRRIAGRASRSSERCLCFPAVIPVHRVFISPEQNRGGWM